MWRYASYGSIVIIQELLSERKTSTVDVNRLLESFELLAQHSLLYFFLFGNGGDQDLTDVHGYRPRELIDRRLLSAVLEEKYSYVNSSVLNETDFLETRHFATFTKSVFGIVTRSLRMN